MTRDVSLAARLAGLPGTLSLLWCLTLLFCIEKQVIALMIVSPEADIIELSFAFGGYVEGLLDRGEFTSCERGTCEYASRMPALPMISAGLGLISRDMLDVTLLKNALWSGLFLMGIHFVLANAGGLRQIVLRTTNLGLAFAVTSPALFKHAGVPFYEEAYLIELLFLFWLCFMLLLATVWTTDSGVNKPRIAGLFLLLGILAFLFKETMLGLTAVAITGTLILAVREGKALFRPLGAALMLIGVAALGLWIGYVTSSTGRPGFFTTFNGENRWHGANPMTMALYPDISPDRMFDSERAVLKDGTEVLIPRIKQRHEFASDAEWDATRRQQAADWRRDNPDLWWQFTQTKTENFFLSTDKTPRSTRAIYAEPEQRSQRIYNQLLAGWLVWARVVQVIGAGLILWVLVTGPWTARFLAVGVFLGLLAYASPYLLGINYERHISPWLLLMALSCAFLLTVRRAR